MAGGASTAAYKRWEKAAIAGVSLVADAAEHLERTSTDREVEHTGELSVMSKCHLHVKGLLFDLSIQIMSVYFSEQNGYEYSEKDIPSLRNNLQNSEKLKLQLFPIDESTRRALEMVGC